MSSFCAALTITQRSSHHRCTSMRDTTMAQPEPDAPVEDLRGTVLCIEDDPVNRMLVEAMLSAFPRPNPM